MTSERTKNPRRAFSVAFLCLVLGSVQAFGQVVAGYSEYIIPGDENQMGPVLCSQGQTACPSTYHMHTVISLAGWADATSVYYDHWEDGYNFDPFNPATADETYLVNEGQFKIFETANIALPTATRSSCTPAGTCNYDGRDRLWIAGGAVTITRISWVEERGVGIQGTAWEIYPVKPQLTNYVVPFGETTGWYGFQRVAILIQATRDNTTVQIDLNHDGTWDMVDFEGGHADLIHLDTGESYLLNDTSANVGAGNLAPGIIIKGNQTLQVKYVAGRNDVNNCTRGFSAFPRGYWTTDYYAPLNQPGPDVNGQGSDTDYFLYNPNSSAIAVNWHGSTTAGSFSIPATSTVSFRAASGTSVPTNSGLYFKGSNVFWGVGSNDTTRDGATTGYAHEWGYSLLPSTMLFEEHFQGWSPDGYHLAGDPPLGPHAGDTQMGVFVIAAQDNTRLFVDLQNDGTYDQTYALNRLETRYVTDPDGDLSGARIWATGPFTMAYGQNSATSDNSSPAMDLGYVAIPSNDFTSLVLMVDKAVDPVMVPAAAGSQSTFTLTVNSAEYPADNVLVIDNLAYGWGYVSNTTTITLPNVAPLSGSAANPTVTAPGAALPSPFTGTCPTGRGPCLTWDSSKLGSLTENQQIVIGFTAETTTALPAGTLSENRVTASGTRTIGGILQTFTASDFAYNVSGELQITKDSNAGTPAYPGDTFTYTAVVTNPAPAGTNLLTGISLYDPIPAGLTNVAGTTTISHSTVADAFNSRSYSLNVGTRSWSGDWTEGSDGSGGATGGDIQVTAGGELVLDNSNSNEPRVARAVNLTGATSAFLSFSYRTGSGVDAGDHIYVQAATGGTGGSFTTVANITGIAGAASGTYGVDLASYISANTAIRFIFPNGSYQDTNESFWVDNLSITYNVTVSGPNPPELISASSLYALPGSRSITATFDVTVNTPFPTGQTSVTNTASVTAKEIPVPLKASVTDIVSNRDSQSATVAGRVWLDADGDGVDDVGEPGIGNVEVTLTDQYGTPVATILTDSGGRFLFTGVAPGTGYYVEATAPPDPAGEPLIGLTQSAPSGHTDYRTNAFNLSAGQDYTGADQGYKPASGTVSFGDLVWLDTDSDRVRDAGEAALGGVTLRLYRDVNGDGLLNVLTDAFVPTPVTGVGAIAVTTGSASVTGSGTRFTSLGAGDPIVIGGVSYAIASVTDDTHLTLSTSYTGTSATNVTFTAVSRAGTGTVAATSGSSSVVGSGTTFTSLAAGDPIVINGVTYKVASVTDDTNLTLTTSYAGTTATGLTYGIAAQTTSDADGSYLFTGVTPTGANYFVTATTPSGYSTTTGTLYGFMAVTGGTAYLTADFGFNTGSTYSITDRAWRDLDADGTFDAGEVGIPGVTVELLDATGSVVATTVTGSDGAFTFSGLSGGGVNYTTRITDTAGVLTGFYGTTSYAVAGQRAENISAASINRSAAPSYGYNVTRAIGDTVYYDVNGNGSQDGGEAGMAGAVVSLYRDVDGSGTVSLSAGPGTVTTTGASAVVTGTGTSFLCYHAGEPVVINGVTYTIASVASNTSLTLTTVPPANGNVAYSGPSAGSGAIRVTNGSAEIVGTGTSFTDYRAGDLITINNGGTAYVVYTILSVTDDTHLALTANYTGTTSGARTYYGPGDALLGTVTTDASGQYLFSGLPNGHYLASVGTPSGFTHIPGTRPDIDTGLSGIQLAATIDGTANVFDRDFGFQANTSRTISGTIWNDPNANGLIDAGENGVEGVTVNLLNGTTVIATTTTGAGGAYSFTGVASGTYTVQVTDTAGLLTGYVATYQKTGGTGGPFTGSEAVDVTSGNATDIDFGYKEPPPTYAALDTFTALTVDRTVTLQWRTSSEIGTVGFDILRYDPRSGSFRKLNDALLPGLLMHPQGGAYRFRDDDAPLQEPLAYKLVEVDVQGRLREHGPFVVVPGSQIATETEGGEAAENIWSDGLPFQSRPNPIATEHQRRLRAAAAEQLDAAAEAARAKGGTAKITTNGEGLYFVPAAQVANALGMTSKSAADAIRKGQMDLTSMGEDVPYLPAGDGSGFYFHAEPPRTIYSAEVAYMLTTGKGTTIGGALRGTSGKSAASFESTIHREENHFAIPVFFPDPDGDFWCWDYVFAGYPGADSKSYTVQARGVAGTGPATLKVLLHGGSDIAARVDHHAVVLWNGTTVGEATWDGTVPYELTIPLGEGMVQEGDNTLQLQGFLNPNVAYSIVYLDYFELTYERLFRAHNDELSFTAPNGVSVTIGGFSSTDILVLDLGTENRHASVVTPAIGPAADGTYQAQFVTRSGRTPHRYLAVAKKQARSPAAVTAVEPTGLKDHSNRAEYVLIAPSSLVAAVQPLAAYRSAQGLRTMVVRLSDIYNEFNGGNASPYAIRDFLAYAVKRWHPAPRYATLVGRGTFDYKDYTGIGDCLVPSLMAATPGGMFVSDNRIADFAGDDGIPDIALGRLPFLTSEEVSDYLTKVRVHERAADPRRILMVADDPDHGGSFNTDSDTVAALVPSGYSVLRVYLPAYSGPQANRAIVDAINRGVEVFNYVGHGSVSQLADEKLFQPTDIPALTNASVMPMFLGMTCTVGMFSIPGYPSLAERLLSKQGGGIYASWSSTGLAENDASVMLDKAFFTAIFAKRVKTVGEAVVQALRSREAAGVSAPMKNLYSLLGEPVTRLP